MARVARYRVAALTLVNTFLVCIALSRQHPVSAASPSPFTSFDARHSYQAAQASLKAHAEQLLGTYKLGVQYLPTVALFDKNGNPVLTSRFGSVYRYGHTLLLRIVCHMARTGTLHS